MAKNLAQTDKRHAASRDREDEEDGLKPEARKQKVTVEVNTCKHPVKVSIDLRVGYGEVKVEHSDVTLVDYGASEAEDVEFPEEIEDLGIRNNGSSSCVEVILEICTKRKRVVG